MPITINLGHEGYLEEIKGKDLFTKMDNSLNQYHLYLSMEAP
jgi:hypothetical protein